MSGGTQRNAERGDFGSAVVTALSVVVFAIVLHHSYKTYISPAHSYQGLGYRPPEAFNLLASTLIGIVLAWTLPRTITKASHFLLWAVFVVAALPAILVSQYATILKPDEATVLGLHVAGTLLLCRIVAAAGPRGVLPVPPDGLRRHFWPVVAVFSVVIYTVLIAYVGIRVRLLIFDDVYDARSEFGEATSTVPLMGYLLPLQYNVLNPIMMAKGLYARKALPIVLGGGGQVLIYMTVGHKSVLLSTVAILAVVWLLRHGRQTGVAVLLATASAILLAVVVDKLIGSIVFTSLLVRRFLVVPGILTAAYVRVFGDRPKTNFSDSILPFLENPYEAGLNPTHIVGSIFAGNSDISANVSLFGHGFLSYGYLGMYVEGLVLAGILWLVDDATEGLPLAVAGVVFVMPAVAIASASIFTAMLTHGLLAAVLLAAALPRTGWERRGKAGESRPLHGRARPSGIPTRGSPPAKKAEVTRDL